MLTRPIPNKLPEIYRTLGTEYAERVLPSIIQVCCCQGGGVCAQFAQPDEAHALDAAQETLKSVIAQYNASQLLTMREVRPCMQPHFACVQH